MGMFNSVMLLLLTGALAFSLYMLYQNLPDDPVELIPIDSPISNGLSMNSVTNDGKALQFYPNMRFRDRKISYFIENICSQEKKSLVIEAFKEFEFLTLLEFYPSSDTNAEISITCSELAPEPTTRRHFVAGEGGPTEIINTSLYSVILKGKISLYRDETCGKPKIAIHEMLHVLGFDHNNNAKSILYPTLNCNQEIDDYLIDEINRLYTVNKAPDLMIDSVKASLAGRYLSFDIEIGNQGLDTSKNVKLDVYADSKIIDTFDLGDIEIGTKKILTVKNVRASRSTNSVAFKVSSSIKDKEEIDALNNIKELMLQK